MSSVYRFPGGIHPQEGVGGKAATAGLPIVEVPQPSRVAIPLQQHIGAPCKPLVQKGDTVKAGQKIGRRFTLLFPARWWMCFPAS